MRQSGRGVSFAVLAWLLASGPLFAQEPREAPIQSLVKSLDDPRTRTSAEFQLSLLSSKALVPLVEAMQGRLKKKQSVEPILCALARLGPEAAPCMDTFVASLPAMTATDLVWASKLAASFSPFMGMHRTDELSHAVHGEISKRGPKGFEDVSMPLQLIMSHELGRLEERSCVARRGATIDKWPVSTLVEELEGNLAYRRVVAAQFLVRRKDITDVEKGRVLMEALDRSTQIESSRVVRLGGRSDELRLVVAQTLCSLKSGSEQKKLTERGLVVLLGEHPDACVREWAVNRLTAVGSEAALDAVATACHDRDENVAIAAMDALLSWGPASRAKRWILTQALYSESEVRREAAASAMLRQNKFFGTGK